MAAPTPRQRRPSAPAVQVRKVIDGQDEIGRAVSFDVTIGRRTYRNGAVIFLDFHRGWRRIFGRYAHPQLYLGDDLENRCDRDIDLLQVVAGTAMAAAA